MKLAIVTIALTLASWLNEPVTTIGKLTRYEIKNGYEEKFRQALGNYVMKSLPTKSNIMSEVYYEQDKPSVVWLIERWTSKNELNHFSRDTTAKVLASLTKDALVHPADVYFVKDLEPLTKQQWRVNSKTSGQQLMVMLFVDAKKGTQQHFKNLYHTAMPQFRSEPGVITYQLSEIEGDETKFVTYEKFKDKEAFAYHLQFPPIKPVVEYLETSIKNPPFQQGLHQLIQINY